MAEKSVILPKKLANKVAAATPASQYDKGSLIPQERENFQQNSVRTLRDSGRTIAAIRELARTDGMVSMAVYSYVEVADSGWTIRAYDSSSHEFSPEGTALARAVLASMDTLYDYSIGYADKPSSSSTVTSALREAVLTGGVAGELVLDKARLPDRLNLIAIESLRYRSRGDGTKYPVQQTTGDEVELDIPNFWVVPMHQEANKTYPVSMYEAALNSAFYYLEFIEDMRRVVRKSGHSRLWLKLNREAVLAAAPPDIQKDHKKLQTWMEDIRKQVEDMAKDMEPEDTLVSYDVVEVESLATEGEKADYKELLTALSGIFATALKSHPSILGLRLTGSQSLSNTESLIFLKIAKAIQKPVSTLLSRALTLATRLYGSDVYVKFQFLPIDLRPENELEAFRTMKQTRILELLSLGFLSDEEAAIQLSELGIPVGMDNMPNLSGTMFHQGPANGTRADEVSPNQDPQGRALQPNTPKKAGGESQ